MSSDARLEQLGQGHVHRVEAIYEPTGNPRWKVRVVRAVAPHVTLGNGATLDKAVDNVVELLAEE